MSYEQNAPRSAAEGRTTGSILYFQFQATCWHSHWASSASYLP